ncbi:MAG: ester cyclase [Chloroflexi bacterium]|nr:ester cyclase [Chloroflexota bacterium]
MWHDIDRSIPPEWRFRRRCCISEIYRAIVQRLIEQGFNTGDLDFVDEALAHDRVSFHVSGEMQALDAFKLIISLLRHIFPDFQVAVEDAIYEGDRAIVRWRAMGTYTGDVPGAAPTGKSMAWTGITINRFAEDKIAEVWLYVDSTAPS